ncbi:MAG: sialate O-acetylesterase, partial [Imperialibacter sp.]
MNVTHLKLLLFVCVITILPACQSHKPQTWVFVMAGQSNMAGRGIVEPQDTVTNPRIL